MAGEWRAGSVVIFLGERRLSAISSKETHGAGEGMGGADLGAGRVGWNVDMRGGRGGGDVEALEARRELLCTCSASSCQELGCDGDRTLTFSHERSTLRNKEQSLDFLLLKHL